MWLIPSNIIQNTNFRALLLMITPSVVESPTLTLYLAIIASNVKVLCSFFWKRNQLENSIDQDVNTSVTWKLAENNSTYGLSFLCSLCFALVSVCNIIHYPIIKWLKTGGKKDVNDFPYPNEWYLLNKPKQLRFMDVVYPEESGLLIQLSSFSHW